MCGITGWLDWRHDLRGEKPTTQAMTDTLACRGPDAGGTWSSARAALGHRRLAVIDLAGGAQPLTDAGPEQAPRAVLSYNGELYNYRELRAELQSLGHHFRTDSDTEVVLHAHTQWGADAPRRLNGIYAYAIWDTRDEELTLVRDRLGIKPLGCSSCEGSVLIMP